VAYRFYGGLICAGLGFFAYAWKKKIPYGHFFDSVAPVLLLANGLGRMAARYRAMGTGAW